MCSIDFPIKSFADKSKKFSWVTQSSVLVFSGFGEVDQARGNAYELGQSGFRPDDVPYGTVRYLPTLP